MAGGGTPIGPSASPLGQAWGYGIVLGIGFLFALGMVFTTWVLKRYNNELQTSEMFSTAGRTVKSGLVASAVVSSWTWAATLLQSSSVAFRYGVSGPLWYAAGATVQILLFATVAIELKRRAPNAHTFLEAVRARYGKTTHLVYITFGLFTNILVTAMLLTGGSAVISSLTGVPTAAACFLLPLGVVIYTMFGGIKATFLTDYVHTVILLIILLIFAFTTYATGDRLGSPKAVYERLQELSETTPVPGNAGGSYLTMRSKDGAIFFVINIIGNFGTVFMDNGYYNKAIAASPIHALPGYIIGGLSWFAIPWLCATTMGLAALALQNTEYFPTYPEVMDEASISAGLTLPYAAVALLGSGGAVATLLVVFMAVTSAFSAQLISVSSILTYDIYGTYINSSASGRRMGWLYVFMGVIISSAVLPATLTLMWKGQNKWAATLSPILGLCCSITAWLVTTSKLNDGVITVATSGANNPMLAGNVVALLSPIIFIPVLTLIFGFDNYDWVSMKNIRLVDDSDVTAAAHMDLEAVHGRHAALSPEAEAAEQAKLFRASKIAKITTATMTLVLLVLWPMPLYGTGYIFSQSFFSGWVIVGIIWLMCSTMAVGVYPLWEGRESLARNFGGMWRDVMGKGRHRGDHVEVTEGEKTGESGTNTPKQAYAKALEQ
ncbi:PutP, Na+proline symporter [Pyrenophora tritici-repentis]|uniref:Sodium solute symporter protein n=1 Tax=Pyrenophora tritici-repentis TaxID=45151 RepID=A0A2W1DC52_9PLEO|nr:Sodium solute symporter protein [Pyrenophora tritici-repentis]KAI1673513.1 Sodium solute symporter protein [Pyrenophora tritici-repentis]KAI1689441.1 Sodium solute symporter protein [Pyrenophora tritici-repentis]PWO21557.1 Amelogenin domain containing protein [Pyrenophora tritici-repentis]PZD37750.1 PutP, Na+proline symporter [Pyrenophora tritici-repentis]